MILILAEDGTEPIGNAIADALRQEYSLPCTPAVVPTDAVWNRDVEWDDLLLVVFQSDALPDAATKYIEAFRTAHENGGAIVPVATRATFRKPPDPISCVKSAEYDGTPASTALITKAG